MVHWDIADGWATSPSCPACASPARRSWARSAWRPRTSSSPRGPRASRRCSSRGGLVLPPAAAGAVPAQGAAADARACAPSRRARTAATWTSSSSTKGATLYMPVARGRAPCSRSATATSPRATARCCVHRGRDGRHRGGAVQRASRARRREATSAGRASRHRDYFAPPEWAAPRASSPPPACRSREDGVNEGEDLTLAAPQRAAQHDRAPAGARLDPRAGLRDLQRRGRPAR